MTDRELLELAARAAGLKPSESDGVIYAGFGSREWDPLADDGDALRLVVRLGLSIHRQYNSVGVSQYGNGAGYLGGWSSLVIEKSDEDITRRAIVRAAAEIGKVTA